MRWSMVVWVHDRSGRLVHVEPVSWSQVGQRLWMDEHGFASSDPVRVASQLAEWRARVDGHEVGEVIVD